MLTNVWYSDLEKFTPAIQLMAGVNFAYIMASLIGKLTDIFSNAIKKIDAKSNKLHSEIHVDIESLKAFKPLTDSDGKTNSGHIAKLQKAYEDCSEKWDNKAKELTDYYESHKNFYGFQIICLFVSLYCIVDLILIGYASVYRMRLCSELYAYNWVSLIAIAIYTVRILKHPRKEDVDDRRKCVYIKGLVIAVSLVWAAILNHLNIGRFWLQGLNECLSVVIPFLPFVIGSLYVLFIDKYLECKMRHLEKEISRDISSAKAELTNLKAQYDTFQFEIQVM